MELSLRLDTLGMVEVRYLRGRDRYRDWPPFLLLAASRQARVSAYLSREVIDQLHQQVLAVEEAGGLGADEDDDEEEDNQVDDAGEKEETRQVERESSTLSPAFAQALERLNDLARQRLPEAGSSSEPGGEELGAGNEIDLGDEEDALEQLQDAFVQMMEVVRELAEELSTDALKLRGRCGCACCKIYFRRAKQDGGGDAVEGPADSVLQGEVSWRRMELALSLRL